MEKKKFVEASSTWAVHWQWCNGGILMAPYCGMWHVLRATGIYSRGRTTPNGKNTPVKWTDNAAQISYWWPRTHTATVHVTWITFLPLDNKDTQETHLPHYKVYFRTKILINPSVGAMLQSVCPCHQLFLWTPLYRSLSNMRQSWPALKAKLCEPLYINCAILFFSCWAAEALRHRADAAGMLRCRERSSGRPTGVAEAARRHPKFTRSIRLIRGEGC